MIAAIILFAMVAGCYCCYRKGQLDGFNLGITTAKEVVQEQIDCLERLDKENNEQK